MLTIPKFRSKHYELCFKNLLKKDKYRIIMIEGANAIPCTGTHVKRTGEVRKIVVKNWKNLAVVLS